MSNLHKLITELEQNIPLCDRHNAAISGSNVGWHIEHSLLVINGIIKQLEKSNPADYTWKLNFPKTIIFLINRIPRGKGKAPKVVQPTDAVTQETLTNSLQKARNLEQMLSHIPAEACFQHPSFGYLKRDETIKFLCIHTQHHLAIVKDILK
jgi:hypothetical protein